MGETLFKGLDGLLNILSSILTVVFNEVFTPIMTDTLMIFYELFYTQAMIMFSYLYYLVLLFFCKIVDTLEAILNIFVGTTMVSMNGSEEMSLMHAVFEMDVVSRAFLVVTLVAIVVCFFFTIFATARSISSMTLEDRNPISHVLKNAMKACVSFMLVPFLCVFMLQLSSALTEQLQTSILSQSGNESGKPQTIGMYIFLTSSLRAGKDGIANETLGTNIFSYKYLPPDFNDELRKEYRFGTKDYLDVGDSGVDFSQFRIDYFMGYVASIFMMIMLVGMIVMFIRRMLELVMMYIASPFFVATIPLDDGAMFKGWRERFIAKFVSGFGVIFVLKIYLILLPILFSPDLDLGSAVLGERATAISTTQDLINNLVEDIPGADASQINSAQDAINQIPALKEMSEEGIYNGLSNSVTNFAYENFGIGEAKESGAEASLIDSLIKLIFMMGGTWAVYKSRTLIVEVMNPDEERMARSASAAGLRVAAKGVEVAKTAVEIGGTIAVGVATAGTGSAAMVGAKGIGMAAKSGAAAGQMTAKQFGKQLAGRSALNSITGGLGAISQAGKEDMQE